MSIIINRLNQSNIAGLITNDLCSLVILLNLNDYQVSWKNVIIVRNSLPRLSPSHYYVKEISIPVKNTIPSR